MTSQDIHMIRETHGYRQKQCSSSVIMMILHAPLWSRSDMKIIDFQYVIWRQKIIDRNYRCLSLIVCLLLLLLPSLQQFIDESNDGLQIKNDRQTRLLNPLFLRTVVNKHVRERNATTLSHRFDRHWYSLVLVVHIPFDEYQTHRTSSSAIEQWQAHVVEFVILCLVYVRCG
jgi:hypothetical protein